jgi:uncharacterized protein YkwD
MIYRIPLFGLLMYIAVFAAFPQKQNMYEVSQKEWQFIEIFLSDTLQQRKELIFDTILHRVARERAMDLATRNYFSHTNPDGIGPNHFVRAAGYVLPDHYGKHRNANNVESIAAGNETAATTYEQWLYSKAGHRKHILGELDFWLRQTHFGIGYHYSPDAPYRHYWVFISAPAPEK